MNILIVDENEVVRRQLFWALRKGNALHEAAGRVEARAILAGLQPDVILLEPLEEGDADVRREAALSLGRIGSKDGVDALLQTIREDDDPQVRWRAAMALGRIGDHGIIPVLQKLVDAEEEQMVKEHLLEAIGSLGGWSE